MGNKYTIEAGTGNSSRVYIGTEYLVVALYFLYITKVDNNSIHWKRLTIR